jgi:ABC-type Fe3+ transport system permease subunit
MTQNFSDTKKHHLDQYNRMQDLLNQYASLAVKLSAIVSAGGLVSIGAAFTNLLSFREELRINIYNEINNTLTNSFLAFAVSFSLVCIGLILIYFSRYSFLTNTDYYGESEETRKKALSRGQNFEVLSVICFILSFLSIVFGIFQIYSGMLSLS